MSGGTYSLMSTSNNRFLKNFSWQFYSLLGILFHISFSCRCLTWGLNRGLTLPNRPTHCLIDHSDFYFVTININFVHKIVILIPITFSLRETQSKFPIYHDSLNLIESMCFVGIGDRSSLGLIRVQLRLQSATHEQF